MKFDKLRTLLADGALNWGTQTITLAAVSGYSFSASHASLADIQLSGATVLATGRLQSKSVSSDGWAKSSSVTLSVVPQGGPYDLILFLDTTGTPTGIFPLVEFPDALTVAANGDVIVRPDGALVSGVGNWFKF